MVISEGDEMDFWERLKTETSARTANYQSPTGVQQIRRDLALRLLSPVQSLAEVNDIGHWVITGELPKLKGKDSE